MKLQEIIDVMAGEFGVLKNRFQIFKLPIAKAPTDPRPGVASPGVYVFVKDDQIIKVGRHFVNARKRALEHLRDNTGGTMGAMRDDPNTTLILFNTIQPDDLHWVAALEVLFEQRLRPLIRCGRLG